MNKKDKIDRREVVVIMARTHPSETGSSFVMRGVINYAFGLSSEARYLRSKFILKIIPMVNPDGVIHGNTRTSLIGRDLNRRWVNPSKKMYPEIFSIKEYLHQLKNVEKK